MRTHFKNIFFILVGCAIFSFGVVNINIENNLAEGGFTGVTLLLYAVFHISPSVSNLVLNIPVFIVGWKLLGRKSFVYTIIGTVGVSIFLELFQTYPVHIALQDDMFLASLFAGVFIGAGLGIVFRFGGTTGGVDIIARLVQKYAGWNMGRTMFMFDACVITLSLLTYLTYQEAMYTLVVVFIAAQVIDFMQEGAYIAKGATIFSQDNELIAEKIMSEMHRGATMYKGYGTYTKKDRDILYCVVSRNELAKLKEVIHSVDPHAFVSVSDVHDVFGEGFTFDANKKPIEQKS